jgi:hypothetical protein
MSEGAGRGRVDPLDGCLGLRRVDCFLGHQRFRKRNILRYRLARERVVDPLGCVNPLSSSLLQDRPWMCPSRSSLMVVGLPSAVATPIFPIRPRVQHLGRARPGVVIHGVDGLISG